jgi:ubiquinone/menaquinone biosynthesis C-methylase UbiE
LRPTLADALAVVIPALPTQLATQRARDAALEQARWMPPIARGGFEVRLEANAQQVDMQQCVVASAGEPALLRSALAARRDQGDDADTTWEPLVRFVDAWGTGSADWSQSIPEVWLEYDGDGPDARTRLPSLFLALGYEDRSPTTPAVVDEALDILLGGSWHPWRAQLRRCFEAADDAVFISHIGVMLSRGTPGLRVNVKRLQRDTLPGYLRGVGWAGDSREVAALGSALFAVADRATLALDVGEAIADRIGLECAVDEPSGTTERWAQLLDVLVDAGLCTSVKRDAVLEWPGVDTPAGAVGAWPTSLMALSLSEPVDSFTTLERRLSHVKVTAGGGFRAQSKAKAYLWFAHRWSRPTSLDSQPRSPDGAQRRAAASPSTHLERVRAYYEATTPAYLAHLGTTFQGWLLGASGDAAESNRRLAARAGIRAGQVVLDAGCGVGGPAIAIAHAWGVTIEGITISDTQATVAGRLIADAGMEESIAVRTGDFHQLPWPVETFDTALFLESAGQSESPTALYREVFRVLKPGGILYIKDAFKPEDTQLSEADRTSISAFDELFVYRTTSLDETSRALAAEGFAVQRVGALTGLVTGDRWRVAATEVRAGSLQATSFGNLHRAAIHRQVVFCGEVVARKPHRGN